MEKGKVYQQIGSCLFIDQFLTLRSPPPPIISFDFQ